METTLALSALLPGVEWSLDGQDLSTLVIHTPGVVAPTQAQVDAWIAANSYRGKRAKAYPPIGDQLDAIMKGGDEFNAMKKRIDAIKAQYPKPE